MMNFFRKKFAPSFLLLLAATALLSSCQSDVAPSQKSGTQAMEASQASVPQVKGQDVHLVSPFPSSVKDFPLANFHLVAKNKGRVYRGMRPMSLEHAKILKDQAHITDVLIFRETTEDVPWTEEFAWFKDLGFADQNIFYIPFRWKNLGDDFKRPCLETFEALEKMRFALATEKQSLFVHCTVGEDRTGYLMGLYRMAFEGWDFAKTHREEMCAKGYVDANSNKPENVNVTLHDNVSVLFLKMEWGLKNKKWSAKNLDRRFCEQDPMVSDVSFKMQLATNKVRMSCKKL